MTDELMQSVTHSSIKCEDKFNEQLNRLKSKGFILACQKSCVSSYTSQHHIHRYVRKHKEGRREGQLSWDKEHAIPKNIVYFVEKSAKILIRKIQADGVLTILFELSWLQITPYLRTLF